MSRAISASPSRRSSPTWPRDIRTGLRAVTSDTFDMHRRHGEAVRRGGQAIEDNRWLAVDRPSPRTRSWRRSSLGAHRCRLIGPFIPRHRGGRQRARGRQRTPNCRVAGTRLPAPARLVPDSRRLVSVDRRPWPSSRVRTSALVEKLKPYHDADVERADPRPSIATCRPGLLGRQSTIGQHARRCRNAIADAVRAEGCRSRSAEPLVQSRKHHGYRIDPEARFVDDVTELLD